MWVARYIFSSCIDEQGEPISFIMKVDKTLVSF